MVSIWTRYISGVTKGSIPSVISQNPTMRPGQLRAGCRMIWEKNQMQLKPGPFECWSRHPTTIPTPWSPSQVTLWDALKPPYHHSPCSFTTSNHYTHFIWTTFKEHIPKETSSILTKSHISYIFPPMMIFIMVLEIPFLCKSQTTHSTNIRFIIWMYPSVPSHIILNTKSLPTHITHMGFLPCVGRHMVHKVLVTSELFPAVGTSEGK